MTRPRKKLERRLTGGTWDPAALPIYFAAGDPFAGESEVDYFGNYPFLLRAVNELTAGAGIDWLLAKQVTLLLDSGIFWLASQHAKTHEMPLDEAFNLAPEEVDGFVALWNTYVDIVQRHGDELWGYVELDLGGEPNKRRTRASLEAMGLRPIPVYHPLLDPPGYFDELCQTYDRVAVGNLVAADRPTRKRLVRTIWERRRAYPGVWIHLLGLKPSELLLAYPASSCDASSWLKAVRWTPEADTHACVATFGRQHSEMGYTRGAESASLEGRDRGILAAARECYFHQLQWHQHAAGLDGLGIQPAPKGKPHA